ncbi:hypothetical protein ETD86_40415 [Nonomuraea turkmeniaca]|uniref:Uncharacterized protein n=1 Tax=Nonomuraea turkmeniaca TaxID=103838 RepID=A0A5S4F2K9_9ACTN|nr:DUF6225 family protein [Nonomuraea turkmeniaca]TMR10241.1 hypothetical protein ETD86_40415 [Nonomuraea turkmeniaca]
MSDIDVPRTTVVPWETVTDTADRPAWTAGQLRAAIAHLADDPIVVEVELGEPTTYEDQIIVGAGRGELDWGDGYGLEPDPIVALYCARHGHLRVRPNRPRLNRGE